MKRKEEKEELSLGNLISRELPVLFRVSASLALPYTYIYLYTVLLNSIFFLNALTFK